MPTPESQQVPRPIVRRNASAQERLRELHRLARIMCRLKGVDPDTWMGDGGFPNGITDTFSKWNAWGPVLMAFEHFLPEADAALRAAEAEDRAKAAAGAAELFR